MNDSSIVACVTRAQARQFIDDEFSRPHANKVLHGHPSPMYWRPDDGGAMQRWRRRSEIGRSHPIAANLYLSIPFCIPTEPSHCGYCLFPTQDYQGNSGMQRYLAYLQREADLYAPYFTTDRLASIYVGGGTPNLLKEGDYARLMEIADKLYGSSTQDIERTIEGIPQLFSRDKIAAIKSAGFNRVSMGVQQMCDRLIKYSGRQQTRRQVMDALDYFNEAGLAVNVDLIFGWPQQTVGDVLRDLGELVDQGVGHITHYQLNIAGRSDFSKTRRDLLPSFETSLEMYRESCRFLTSKGFRQATVYDWERIDQAPDRFDSSRASGYDYERNLRAFLGMAEGRVVETNNMIGLGYAGISYPFTCPVVEGPNWCQINARNLDGYFQAIDAGRMPIERQFLYAEADIKLTWLFHSMQTMAVDIEAYTAAFGSNLLEDYGPIWEELHDRNWVVIDGTTIRFEGLGQFLMPMLQALFGQARLAQLRGQPKHVDAGTTAFR